MGGINSEVRRRTPRMENDPSDVQERRGEEIILREAGRKRLTMYLAGAELEIRKLTGRVEERNRQRREIWLGGREKLGDVGRGT